MNFGSLDEFLAMGGYGLYVWGSVVVCFAFMAGELWQVRARRQAIGALILRKVRYEGKA